MSLMTHRGFTIDKQGQNGYVDLPLIDRVYHHMETTHNFADDFEFVKDVLAAAKQILFDRDGRFLLAKQMNTPCSQWVFKFTVSTLLYLSGEPRKISLENFRDLMVFHPTDVVATDSSLVVRQNNLGWVFDASASTILSRWLAQEEGLTDLVMTMYLVGGSLPTDWYRGADQRPPT